jgi:hypothetical protein
VGLKDVSPAVSNDKKQPEKKGTKSECPGFQSQIAKNKFGIKMALKYQYLDIPETRFYVAKTAVVHGFASLLAAAKTLSFLLRYFHRYKTGLQCFGKKEKIKKFQV